MGSRFIIWIITICILSIVTVVLIFYFNGKTVKEHYDNGALKAIYSYKNGKIEGEYVEYYRNGEIRLKARFADGVQVDTLKAYYDNGTLKELSYLRNGKKDGPYVDFYPNGKRKSIGWAKEGYKDSLFTYYSKNETIDSIISYHRGTIKMRAFFERHQVNYEDFEHNYFLKFPENWEFDLSQREAVLLLKNKDGKRVGDFTESLNITLYQHEPSMGIKEFASSYLLSMKQDIPSFKLLDIVYIDNKCEIRYTATYGERHLEAFVTLVYDTNEAYLITCTADQINYKIFDNTFKLMSNSFRKILDPHRQNLVVA